MTGLFYRTVPENTHLPKHDANTLGRKSSKKMIWAVLCANAEGSHRLTPVVVVKVKQPHALKGLIDKLPVHYYLSSASFTEDIAHHLFMKHAVPEIRRHQLGDLKAAPEDVRAVILICSAPTYPKFSKLCGRDGQIKCLAAPPHTAPFAQGISVATKRI